MNPFVTLTSRLSCWINQKDELSLSLSLWRIVIAGTNSSLAEHLVGTSNNAEIDIQPMMHFTQKTPLMQNNNPIATPEQTNRSNYLWNDYDSSTVDLRVSMKGRHCMRWYQTVGYLQTKRTSQTMDAQRWIERYKDFWRRGVDTLTEGRIWSTRVMMTVSWWHEVAN